ncbi:2-oxoglutarate and iron-dependent oxygenase domain-containing protein CP2-like [Impatiens glandulifera]|uniref:2-oxoglutarate and iron-dependent oxygenase domain-containing protein CP2-like n=1 Tax=Impatiens glandulifera TaxID=253017 RepID=UPI001FB1208A|nr:2-oxoglutarate and iron-dependent oxygenase domain-containing protein CP2-like [Impatiens glandulifera]XP_047340763.1 2-oxoglutarate and iron-dependent oxygenase domain-containing protein CP2-like [Impatiens glandulifera]XP_047340764.1 2-oxoglutarate and iron-dependent oxygenase domain-containing protein CP2-like [Impatiens glandulifera]
MPILNNVDRNQTQAGPSISGSEELPSYSTHPLCLSPNTDHTPDNYEDLNLEFSPLIFSAMERHLHPDLLNATREFKVQYISNILKRYKPDDSPAAVSFRDYHLNIQSQYEPLHKELYTMNAEDFFVPDFVKAVKDNTEESYRKIMAEPLSGVFVFDMFQQTFCQMLLSEVENFERWAQHTKNKIMRPNKINKFGAVLDDFGLKSMLNKMVEDFISPISAVFFSAVGGTTLNSHHGFVVEYGVDRDSDLAFHVDDAEVTLNVCLGKNFSGGELYFRGVRCNEHIDSNAKREEIMDYVHVPGRAILHHGRNRHGAKVTKSGHRVNLLVWCRSSVFRQMYKYQTEFPDWCGECQSQKKERRRQKDAANRLETSMTLHNYDFPLQLKALSDGIEHVDYLINRKLQLNLVKGSLCSDVFMSDLTKLLHEMFNKYWRDTYMVMTLVVVMVIFHFQPIILHISFNFDQHSS